MLLLLVAIDSSDTTDTTDTRYYGTGIMLIRGIYIPFKTL